MNAAVIHSFGAPPRYASFADPVAGDEANEVLVTVAAAGLHRVVKSLAAGTHYGSSEDLPFIPGVDGVGRLGDGTRVYFGMSRPPFGTFAERCVTAKAMCLPIPENLDDATVAAMVNPGMSAWAALTGRAQFVAGESVLILGATGVSGQLAVQVAKRFGARRVVAAGRNPEVLESLLHRGADAIISLSQPREDLVKVFRDELQKEKIEIVLDYVWGPPAETLIEAISQKGWRSAGRIRYVQIGSLANPTISLPSEALRSSGLELMGSGFGSASLEKLFLALAEFLREAAKQPFEIKVDAVPLRDVEALWNVTDPGVRLVFQP
jgi:NADPH:quinone reductase-like Zn-dependent oxidoreductase